MSDGLGDAVASNDIEAVLERLDVGDTEADDGARVMDEVIDAEGGDLESVTLKLTVGTVGVIACVRDGDLSLTDLPALVLLLGDSVTETVNVTL